MSEVISIPFVIDGEWLTDLVRTWFWYEDRPYEKCKELICSCISGGDDDVKTEITNAILEGRKKFVGQNTFELVDDGENVRRITDKLKEREYKEAIRKIEDDIRINGIEYVDPFSTVKSIKKAKEMWIRTAEECSRWFQYSDRDQDRVARNEWAPTLSAAEKPTEAGLWLFTWPELIYECSEQGRIEVGSDEFWERIYEAVKSRKGFEERNEKYLARKRLGTDVEDAEPAKFDKRNAHLGFHEAPEIDNSIPCWSGLVAPNGDFYPSDFGSHNSVALHLLNTMPERFGEQYGVYSNGEKFWAGDYDKALDTIVRHGWVALRYIDGYFITDKSKWDQDAFWKPSREQKETVWNAAVKHDVPTDIIPNEYY